VRATLACVLSVHSFAPTVSTPVLVPALSQTGQAAFMRQLYKCMVGQALLMKSSMELHRSINSFGTMIW
jgi:hypothetical protein